MGTIVTESIRSEVATFTKWMVGEGPEMTGMVGGSVGEGSYSGKVLAYEPGATQVIEALYRFDGSRQSFTALVHVEQAGLEAVITGVVTEGLGKGRPVRGSYSEIECEHDGVSTTCWRGSLEVAAES